MFDNQALKATELAVELAREALKAGDDPFGSVLVDANGHVLAQDRNRVQTGERGDSKADPTLHPEFTLARWAQYSLSAKERAESTVYTSGEHCPMCAAAHAYVGLGRIVYVASTIQMKTWMDEAGVEGSPVSPLSINQIAPTLPVEHSDAGLDSEVKLLYQQWWSRKA